MEEDYLKAGKIAAEALKYGASLIKPGASWIEIADKIEIKIAPGMISDLYIAPETTKQNLSLKNKPSENKGSFLSGILGKKEK